MKGCRSSLYLLLFIVLLTSVNGCLVANYELSAPGQNKNTVTMARKDDGPMYLVIPQYYRFDICGTMGTNRCRDRVGMNLEAGVRDALGRVPTIGYAFAEHIPLQGLACAVTLGEEYSDITNGEWFSLMTLLVVPAYTTHKYVVSYSVLLDYETIRVYKYDIEENAITGFLPWIVYPVMYPFWSNIEIGLNYHGPRADIIKQATMNFLVEAHRDGIF